MRVLGGILRGVLIGGLLGFAFAFSGHRQLVWVLAPALLVLALWWLTRGIRLMTAGRFEEALAYHVRMRKWHRRRNVNAALNEYNVANCLAWLGRWAEAQAALEALPVASLPPKLRPYHHYLVALCLAAQRKDLARADAEARKAAEDRGNPGFLLLVAYVADLLGDHARADAAIRAYAPHDPARKTLRFGGPALLFHPERLQALARAFFLGHYHLVRNERAQAARLFEAGLACPFPNGYSQLIRDHAGFAKP